MTIAQLENISKAAELLFLNQPALSKSIGKLEQELGTPLFDRNGKKLSLNAQGERFMECASLILRELELAEADIRQMSSGSTGLISIGAAGCVPKILDCASQFRKTHPDCNFEFDFGIEEHDTIDINDYDVLIYPEGSKYAKFAGYEMGEEKYLLAVPSSHPLASCPLASAKHLAELDYVFVRKGKFYSEFPHRVCTALNIPFHSVCYTDTRQSQMQIIASGMAVGLIPDSLESSFSGRNIRLIPLNNERFSRKMKICFKRRKHLSPLAEEFADMTVKMLKLDNGD